MSAPLASNAPVNAHHDPTLIAVGLAMSVLAPAVVRPLAGRFRRSRGRTRALWWIGAAAGMCVGLWSVHFAVTLALYAPLGFEYDVPLLMLTVFVASAASALAL